ncbi:bcl-2-binding component 3, isoforms 3/4-like [Mustela putorius furo]|uniref:Bcl-2-binding component 3, isoforms 3/4-like n=1 Tax=Mustela putorius furo TaxID=9669 RepID=A0A8U0USM4_MUSPF|nr:bcl-2-binding component 3, isoforms 3/4-like [Mustela putorius furo]
MKTLKDDPNTGKPMLRKLPASRGRALAEGGRRVPSGCRRQEREEAEASSIRRCPLCKSSPPRRPLSPGWHRVSANHKPFPTRTAIPGPLRRAAQLPRRPGGPQSPCARQAPAGLRGRPCCPHCHPQPFQQHRSGQESLTVRESQPRPGLQAEGQRQPKPAGAPAHGPCFCQRPRAAEPETQGRSGLCAAPSRALVRSHGGPAQPSTHRRAPGPPLYTLCGRRSPSCAPGAPPVGSPAAARPCDSSLGETRPLPAARALPTASPRASSGSSSSQPQAESLSPVARRSLYDPEDKGRGPAPAPRGHRGEELPADARQVEDGGDSSAGPRAAAGGGRRSTQQRPVPPRHSGNERGRPHRRRRRCSRRPYPLFQLILEDPSSRSQKKSSKMQSKKYRVKGEVTEEEKALSSRSLL